MPTAEMFEQNYQMVTLYKERLNKKAAGIKAHYQSHKSYLKVVKVLDIKKN